MLLKECCIAENIRLLNKALVQRRPSSSLQYKCVVVVDISGKAESVNYAAKRIVNFFREFIKTYQHFSPDSAHRIYLVNCPFLFRAVWQGFLPFVPVQTRKKIN